MKPWQRNVIVATGLLGLGAARMPFEAGLTRELRESGLTSPQPDVGAMERIGQTGWAVALGGLRTLVATFMNLRAFGFFEEQRWDDMAETYDTIVALAPRSSFYWDNGMWYMAYNAASHYMNDDTMPVLRRREEWRSWIVRGRAFLERGIRNNPDDPTLLTSLAALLASEYKFPAFGDPAESFAGAADAYRRAYETGRALGYVRRAWLFSLARVPGKEKEALGMAHELYADPRNRVPTLQTLTVVLEAHQDPSMDPAKRAIEIFGTPEKAYEALSLHWHRTRERYPVWGVAQALESLEKTLLVPPEKSIFNHPLPPPKGVDDWFETTR